MAINFGKGYIECLESGKIRIGRYSHEVLAYQDYTQEEVLMLKDILNKEDIEKENVLDPKKLEREEKYR